MRYSLIIHEDDGRHSKLLEDETNPNTFLSYIEYKENICKT